MIDRRADLVAPRWSVVIPAFNEAQRLPPYLREVAAYFDGRGQPYEVLVVDDGSADATGDCVREIARQHPAVVLHTLPENRGKGYAVRTGMTRARGGLRLMADADGATPIVEVKRLEAAIEAGAHVAAGSRALRDPSVLVRTRTHRRLSGQVFNEIVRWLGVRAVVDTQCGFKLFRGAVAAELFGAATTDGFGFDVEVILLAQRRGYRITEVPINWADQPGSKVGVLRNGPGMVAEIVAARVRIALGRRERSAP